MTAKYILLCNDGVYYNGNTNVMTLDQWKKELIEWNGGKNLFEVEDFDKEEVVKVDVDEFCQMLIDCVDMEKVACVSKNMVEMGDDFLNLKLIELTE